MATKPDNGGTSNLTALPRGQILTMEEYDRLPYPVRIALSNFPYEVGLSDKGRHLIATHGAGVCAEHIRTKEKTCIQSSALIAYGPDHPQAR